MVQEGYKAGIVCEFAVVSSRSVRPFSPGHLHWVFFCVRVSPVAVVSDREDLLMHPPRRWGYHRVQQ
jgi:hypothetical protein